MNNRKKCNYCKWTGHTDEECRKKKSDNQTSGSTEMNKGKSNDKNTKANITSTPTPTPQDSDSDDTNSESVNATLHPSYLITLPLTSLIKKMPFMSFSPPMPTL